MASSKLRAELADAKKSVREQRDEILTLRERLTAMTYERAQLQLDLDQERASKIATQRGLVAYMQKHGLASRIGYDPDKDPDVRKFEKRLAKADPTAGFKRPRLRTWLGSLRAFG